MPSPDRPPLAAVLLAAGAGQRLGAPKALLELRGRWMLPSLVLALRGGGAAEVVVVIREAERAELEARGLATWARLVVNPEAARGRAGSVRCGLAALRVGAAALIHPCDVPLLAAQAAAALVEAWRAHPRRDELAARLVTPGGRGGHPLLLGAQRVREALRLAEGESLRSLLHRDPALRLDVTWRGDPGPFLDLDTPEQRALLESLMPAPEDQSGTAQR
jgi:nicotine blue oxidoreductase